MTSAPASEDGVFHALRDAILSRRLAPGTRLREVRLGRIFGVSRGIVRKALDRLGFEGLVEHEANRGASVAQPTAEEARQLFAARKCVEVAVARLAARNLTPAAVRRLEAHIAREQAARDRGEAARGVILSGEFHALIGEIAGNAFLGRYLGDLVARESLIIQLYGRQDGVCTQNEHAGILDALKSGDPDEIAARIEAHVDGIAAGVDLRPRAADTRSLEEVLRG